jgi:5-methylcytosine-specific restriction enzyme A
MTPILFLNVGWMSKYEGLNNDPISGGFGQLKKRGYGNEICNLKPHKAHKAMMYGFGRVPHDSIKLERLGAVKGAQEIRNVRWLSG